jgi:hypothetical protein
MRVTRASSPGIRQVSPSVLRRSTAFVQPLPHQPLCLVTMSWRTKGEGLTFGHQSVQLGVRKGGNLGG